MARESEGSNIPAKTRDLGGLVIDIIRSSDAEAIKTKAVDQVRSLFKASTIQGVTYLVGFSGAKYYFFGRLEGQGTVGAVYLNLDSLSNYHVSMITRPDFWRHGVATILTQHVVDFACSNPAIDSLYAHATQGSGQDKVMRRCGFKPYFESQQGGDICVHYSLDTPEKQQVRKYQTLQDIQSGLETMLQSLGIPGSETFSADERVDLDGSVVLTSVVYLRRTSPNQDAEIAKVMKHLWGYFADYFVHPYTPCEMGLDTHRVESIVQSANPDILGPRHTFAFDTQRVFFNDLKGATQLAVVKLFEEGVTLNLYEIGKIA